MNNVRKFLKKKNVVISDKRYLLDVLTQMAQAVFASLLIGLIFKTIGEQGISVRSTYPAHHSSGNAFTCL